MIALCGPFLLLLMTAGVILLRRRQIQEFNQHVESQLYYAVKATGGKSISIEKRYGSTIKGAQPYKASYRDINGTYQTHYVSYGSNGMIYWDRPLVEPSPEVATSKEQIISDMQSQIDALQTELKQVKKLNQTREGV